jgi:hypothetical protein
MYLTNGNPCLERRNARLSKMTEEQKASLMQLKESATLGFVVLKRTRREKKVGDVFVCSVQEGVYYYGRILKVNVKQEWFTTKGCLVVCLYKERTNKKTMDDFKGDINNLMFDPEIVFPQYWSNGYFETIGNVPLTKEEEELDYGFWKQKILKKEGYFVKEDDTYMDHAPKYFNMMGVTLYWGFYENIKEAIIVDPSLAIVKNN